MIRVLALLAVGTMLSGCFYSFDEIWPMKSGERVTLLTEGDYKCTRYENGVPKTTSNSAISTSDGADLYYIFNEEEAAYPMIGSFHKILPDLYVLATTKEGGGEKIYTYVRISEGHAVFIKPTPEQVKEYATKHRITIGEDGELKDDNSILQRRNFIIDLGENLKESETYEDCVPA